MIAMALRILQNGGLNSMGLRPTSSTSTLQQKAIQLFTCDCNYGFASAFHFAERKVRIIQFEATGRGGATDTGFDIQLLKHSSTGWTYSADAFVAGGTEIVGMLTDIGANENDLASGKRFHYHRKSMSTIINGSTEGIVCRVTTTANNAVESMDIRIAYHWV